MLQHEATLSHGRGHSPHTPQRACTLQADEQGVEQEAEATRDRQPNAHHDAEQASQAAAAGAYRQS